MLENLEQSWQDVFANYIIWKGEPEELFSNKVGNEHVSPNFQVLQYPGLKDSDFKSYCTIGASYKVIPHTEALFPETNGVRYEYILHGKAEDVSYICQALLMVATYPYLQHVVYEPCFILPLGAKFSINSPIEYFYFSYPYLDDAGIYDKSFGQIEKSKFLVQTLWVLPITKPEAFYVKEHGADAFEDLLYKNHQKKYDLYDFQRASYV